MGADRPAQPVPPERQARSLAKTGYGAYLLEILEGRV